MAKHGRSPLRLIIIPQGLAGIVLFNSFTIPTSVEIQHLPEDDASKT